MDYISRAPLSSRPHTSGVRSRCAVGILLSASCPNRSGEAHGTKVSPQEWASLRRTLFFYTSPPRSPQQQRIGYKDRLRPDRQLQIWTLFRLRVSFLGVITWITWIHLKIKAKQVGRCSFAGKMRSSTLPRTFAKFAVIFLLLLRVESGSGTNARTCPSPCACLRELVDCGRLKRGQTLPAVIPEWTVEL